jgi:hypothetical protein
MDDREFEQYIAGLCRRDGCTDVQRVGGAGDLGADVIGYLPDGRKIVASAARWYNSALDHLHRTLALGDRILEVGGEAGECLVCGHGVLRAPRRSPRRLPVVSERARAKLNRIAAKMTRPPKQKARPLAQLRAWWKASAILTSGVAADVINSLLEYARVAAAAIRSRVAAVVDVALAAVDVAAAVFVMNGGGRFHRRHLLAEARRHLALVLRGRRREPGLDDAIVDAALTAHCLDISDPKTLRGWMPADPLLHIVGSWSIDRARDVAWRSTLALWELRGSPLAYHALAGSLDDSVAVACRLLLTPVG